MKCCGCIYRFGDTANSKGYTIDKDTFTKGVDTSKKYPVVDETATCIDPENPDSIVGYAQITIYDDCAAAHMTIESKAMQDAIISDDCINQDIKVSCAITDMTVDHETNTVDSGRLVSIVLSKEGMYGIETVTTRQIEYAWHKF